MAFSIPPIGIVHLQGAQGAGPSRKPERKGRATLELFSAYASGLRGLYDGLELWVLTYHVPKDPGPEGAPALGPERGVFATSTLDRPNPIEFLRAQVVEALPERGLLQVDGLESEDGAAILDIRPATLPFTRLTRPPSAAGRT